MSNLLRSLKVTGNDADAFGDTIPPAPPVLCSLFNLVPADARREEWKKIANLHQYYSISQK